MNNYTKLLAGLLNMDMVIEEEDEALILLRSLQDEDYETFVPTLINGKQSLDYNKVCSALVNHELRMKDKDSSNNTSAEALTVRDKSSSRKGEDNDRGRSKFLTDFRDMKKNQCAFCKELRHWKVDCPKIKDKKKESELKGNLAQVTSTQAGGTSQAGGSDSDSTIFLFSVLFLLRLLR